MNDKHRFKLKGLKVKAGKEQKDSKDVSCPVIVNS